MKTLLILTVFFAPFGNGYFLASEDKLKLDSNQLDLDREGPECLTISGPDTGKQCVFPFIHQGNTYQTCTAFSHDQLWCSTEVDDSGAYIQDKWGNCGDGCNQECPMMDKDIVTPGAALVAYENVETWEDCGALCNHVIDCTGFAWGGPEYDVPGIQKKCHLKKG